MSYFSQSIKSTVLAGYTAVTPSQKAVKQRARRLSNQKVHLGKSFYSLVLSVSCCSSDSVRWKAARPQSASRSKLDLCAALIHILPEMDAGVTPPQQTQTVSESQTSEQSHILLALKIAQAWSGMSLRWSTVGTESNWWCKHALTQAASFIESKTSVITGHLCSVDSTWNKY